MLLCREDGEEVRTHSIDQPCPWVTETVPARVALSWHISSSSWHNSVPPINSLDRVLTFCRGTLKTALVNIKMKSDAQLGNPLTTKASLAGFPGVTGVRGSGRIPNRGGSLERWGRWAKNSCTHRTCRDTTWQDRTRCFPSTVKHLGECQKSHCSLPKRAEQRKPASYWR